MSKSRMSRKQAAVIAAAARKLPEGIVSDRSTVHLSAKLIEDWRQLTPVEKGKIIQKGLTLEDSNENPEV